MLAQVKKGGFYFIILLTAVLLMAEGCTGGGTGNDGTNAGNGGTTTGNAVIKIKAFDEQTRNDWSLFPSAHAAVQNLFVCIEKLRVTQSDGSTLTFDTIQGMNEIPSAGVQLGEITLDEGIYLDIAIDFKPGSGCEEYSLQMTSPNGSFSTSAEMTATFTGTNTIVRGRKTLIELELQPIATALDTVSDPNDIPAAVSTPATYASSLITHAPVTLQIVALGGTQPTAEICAQRIRFKDVGEDPTADRNEDPDNISIPQTEIYVDTDVHNLDPIDVPIGEYSLIEIDAYTAVICDAIPFSVGVFGVGDSNNNYWIGDYVIFKFIVEVGLEGPLIIDEAKVVTLWAGNIMDAIDGITSETQIKTTVEGENGIVYWVE